MIGIYEINKIGINATLIEGGYIDAVADTICTSDVPPILATFVRTYTVNQMLGETSCEATADFRWMPTIHMPTISESSANLERSLHLHADVSGKSNMPPAQRAYIVRPTCAPGGSALLLSARATTYRKGKPAIAFNTYGMRKIGGRIIILKDEYI